MPKFLLFFLLFVIEGFGQVFTPTEIHADLAFLKECIEEVHPNPYKFTEQVVFQHIYDSLAKRNQPLDVKQSFLYFQKLTRSIRCGHSSIFLDERLIPPSNLNPKFLPLDLAIFDNRVYVSRNFSENLSLKKGTEITAIEQLPIRKLIQNLAKYAFQNGDGNNALVENYYLQRNFRKMLYLLLGEQDKISLTIKDNAGKEQQLLIKTQSIQAIREIEAERFPIKNAESYKNIYLSEFGSKTALLRIRSFEGNEFENGNFKHEIQTIFEELNTKSTQNLIIDIRNNAGGGLDYADEVLKYLLLKPYQKYQIIHNQRFQEKKKGFSANRFYEHINENLFRGKVFVLINEGTFSAAVYLATHLKNQERATFIGSACGGAADGSSAGDFTSFLLPNTKFTIILPILKINYHGLNSLQLSPDHSVRQNYLGFMKGEDSLLNFAKELIENK